MDSQQQAQFEQRLLDEQAQLLGVADLLHSDEAAPVELDQTAVGRLSSMDAMQQQAMALASQERQGQRLARIKAALERIDDGEFGECLDCLKEIPTARLDIDPSIEYCVNCAK